MTDAKQTRCPHCSSTFRITDAQLAAKGGSVRCGSCLQVFRADLHLVGAAPATPPRPAPAARTAPAPGPAAKPKGKAAAADESWALDLIGEKPAAPSAPAAGGGDWQLPAGGDASDNFGFSDDDISDFIAKGGNAKGGDEPAPGKTVLFDDELSDQLDEVGDGFVAEDPDSHRLSENADESWAKDILSELETEEHKAARGKELEIVDNKDKAAPRNPKMAAAVGRRPAADTAPPVPAPAPRKPASVNDDFLGEDADVLSFLDNDDLSQPVGAAPVTPPPNPFALERPLAHVDAPVSLKPPRDPVRWGYLLGWSFLCLIALAVLATQYLFFNFEALAAKPTVRPYLERACASMGCYVPDIPDPRQLKVDELMVRKHPEVEGALQVDAILKNHASFPQPFPVLRLRFSDSADQVVASRLLRPADYLRGEARILRRMPPDTPVRISLDVVDPGKEAIAYGLEPIL